MFDLPMVIGYYFLLLRVTPKFALNRTFYYI